MKRASFINKDNLQTLAAIVGLLTACLYVSGYVAERVHWNLYGHIEAPADHIQFLYRGGNVVISALASFALYLMLSPLAGLRFILLALVIGLFIFAAVFHKLPAGFRLRLPGSPIVIPYVCFVLLIVLLVYELSSIPAMPENVLFRKDLVLDICTDYFRRYVGNAGLWLLLFLISNWLWARHNGAHIQKSEEPEAPVSETASQHETLGQFETQSTQWSFFFFAQRAVGGAAANLADADKEIVKTLPATRIESLAASSFPLLAKTTMVIAIFLLAFTPAIYGRFQYPHIYPVVRVNLSKDALPGLNARYSESSRQALLFETNDEYILYDRQTDPVILKVRKSQIAQLTILGLTDITRTDWSSNADACP